MNDFVCGDCGVTEGIEHTPSCAQRKTKHPLPSRFCRDCVHIRDMQRITFEKCAVLSKGFDPVTGAPAHAYCASARMRGGECGPEGQLFEARNG